MEKALRLTAQQREDLVAYLDGELPEVETQQIDQVLARNEVARHEVEALARTWELLDLLAQPNASANFTERTLSTLKVSELRTSFVDQPWFGYVRRGAIAVVWIAALAACAAGGFLLTTRAIPNENADLLAELPVVRNLDLYQEINDYNFVKELQRLNLFAVAPSEGEAVPGARRLTPEPIAGVSQAQLSQRYTLVARLPQGERDRMERNWLAYQQLTPARKSELQQLHHQLAAEQESVHAMLETYGMWLQTLTFGEREDLRKAPDAATKIQLVRRFKSEQDRRRETRMFDLQLDKRRTRGFFFPPPDLDVDELALVMNAAKAELPIFEQSQIDAKPTQLQKYLETIRLLLQAARNNQWNEAAVDRVIAQVPDEKLRRELQQSPSKDDRRRELMKQIGRGMTHLLAEERKQFIPTEEQLQQLFVSDAIDSTTRHELMQMNPSDLTSELMRRYFEQLNEPRLRELEMVRHKLWEMVSESMRAGGQRPDWPPFPGPGGFRPRNDGSDRERRNDSSGEGSTERPPGERLPGERPPRDRF